MPGRHTAVFRIAVDDRLLPDDVARQLESAVVEDDVGHPDAFRLVFRDPQRDVLDRCSARIGSAVAVDVVTEGHPAGDRLLEGEVTALEAELDPSGTRTVVRGFDHAHRLFRGRSTCTFREVTVAEVVEQVARRAGLATGRIDGAGPVHPYLAQVNESDWVFLSGLAADVGRDLVVSRGRLELLPPVEAEQAPPPGDLGSAEPLQLVLGVNLLRLRATVTAAQQVEQVEVRGWDPSAKTAVAAAAEARTTSAVNGVEPAQLAGVFGAHPLVVSGAPHTTQEGADRAAAALADRVAGSCSQLEGVARGDPELRAGRAVSIGLLGEPFDGQYTLTATSHRYDPIDGYTTGISVGGRRSQSLLGLTGGGARPDVAVGSLGVGLVTAVDDPDQLGRVKLSLPWLSADFESDWVRVVEPGAGADRGAVVLPEVDDEVLVGFQHGDLRRPVVLGGLHNGVDRPDLGDALVDSSDGSVRRRGFVSRHGHCLVFLDAADDDGIALLTGDRQLRLSLDGTQRRVRIASSGDIELVADGAVRITSGTDTTISARGRLRAEGSVTEVSGQPIRLN